MRKIINDPQDFVRETIEGICRAYPTQVTLLNGDYRMLIHASPKKNKKVGIVTAGGSGHLPVFLGYVGEGLLDGCAVGDVFASPSASKMADLIRSCDYGKGVLCLFGNYGGDKLNFAMAQEEAEFEGIDTISVVISDDIASSSDFNQRRGVAGMVYAFKVAGAAAELGYDLNQVADITQKALANMRTMGIALSSCIIPVVGKPTFCVADGKMEIGMGIHGEAGIEIVDMMPADVIAEQLFKAINTELRLKEGDRVSLMVNGLGATPLEELYIVYRKISLMCQSIGVTCEFPHVGEFATSMEMAGFSLTIFKLDDELTKLMAFKAITPFYTNINK